MIKEDIDKITNAPILGEEVCYKPTDKCFEFDFKHDGTDDIIKIATSGLERSKQFRLGSLYYYRYRFEEKVDTNIRTKFIDSLKNCQISKKDIDIFIDGAIDSLNDYIDLWTYDTVIYPQSISEINRKMVAYLREFGASNFTSYELVKIPPKEMTFDFDSYIHDVLDAKHIFDDRMLPNYTERLKFRK